MSKHIENLKIYISDLLNRKILDLGSGKGKFVLDITRMGGKVTGLEIYQSYINTCLGNARKENLEVEVLQGEAEKLPFKDSQFGFINLSEVLEHVNNPIQSLKEVYRVLESGGKAYLSICSRFSFKDTHFKLYFVNWLPRFMSNAFISIFGKHKEYNNKAGYQKLTQMHYYTFGKINRILNQLDFKVEDIRVNKIREKFKNLPFRILALTVYKLIRNFSFSTFHLLITKNNE